MTADPAAGGGPPGGDSIDRLDAMLERALAGEDVSSDLAALSPGSRERIARALASRQALGSDGPGARARPAPRPSDARLPLERLGPYRLLRLIGQGGQAAVYLAEDPRDGQHVALKVIHGDQTPETLARFRREAEAATRLAGHPGVVAVRESGVEQGRLYIAMGFVDGEPLSALLEREPLPWRRGVEIARGVADALAAAHALGILHRDVKPGNILLDRAGVPRLTDFGLAKTIATGSKLTRTGETVGTPAYMSPEQARGEIAALTPATDVWSLGCVLFEALAGRPPFEGETTAAVIGSIVTREPPPLRAVCPEAPAALERVVRVCLAKRARDRYPEAGALRDDLDRVARGERPRARLAPRRAWMAAVALPALAAVVWASGAFRPAAPDTFPVPLPAVPDPVEAVMARAQARRPLSPGEAAEILGPVAESRPADRALGLLRADCLREAGDWLAAEAAYGRLLDVDPADLDARYGRALTRWVGGQAGETRLDFAGPDLVTVGRALQDGRGSLARGILAWHDRRFGEAEREVAAAGESWEVLFVRALLRHHSGQAGAEDQQAAIRDFTTALGAGPSLAWIYRERGHARKLLGDDRGAREDYDRALEIDPRDVEALVNRGNARRDTGDLGGAIQDYDAALAVRPDEAKALANRGAVRIERGDTEGARADLDAAVARRPDLPLARYNRGTLRMHLRDFRGALEDLDALLQLEPGNTDGLNNRGNVRQRLGDMEGAIADYETCLRLRPDVVSAHANLGVARMKLGQWTKAASSMREAIRLAPEDPRIGPLRGMLAECERRIAEGG